MDISNAKDFSLREVERILKYRREQVLGQYATVLTLEDLTEFEQTEIEQISSDFQHYLYAGKVNEGLVKALTTFPMLRLTGFYSQPIELSLEENVMPVVIKERDEVVKGRYDVLAINQSAEQGQTPFWILVAESKNSEIAHSAGLPQLLVYAHQSLSHQSSVWGLMTNGFMYQFVLICAGNTPEETPTYRLFRPLYLPDPSQATQIIQVLKSLCKLQAPVLVPVAA